MSRNCPEIVLKFAKSCVLKFCFLLWDLCNLRPDGVSLVPWNQGKCVVWDATIPDTLAPSHISSTSSSAGAAAEQAATLKMTKYSNIPNSYLFIPVAIETLGSYCSDALHFLQELGRRICRVTDDKKETTYLFQRLSVAIQRGNAASVISQSQQHLTFQIVMVKIFRLIIMTLQIKPL